MILKGHAHVYGDNIDTDRIIPGKYTKTLDMQQLADHVLEDVDPEFHKIVQPGDMIVAGENFGCGSSREHAPWAILDYGFRVVIAPSFADIFHSNCFKNGILPIKLSVAEIEEFLRKGQEAPYKLTVSLEDQTVAGEDGSVYSFDVDPYYKKMLLNGWDEISLTFQYEDKITEYEQKHA